MANYLSPRRPPRILTRPILRAQETAQVLAEQQLGTGEPEKDPILGMNLLPYPGFPWSETWLTKAGGSPYW